MFSIDRLKEMALEDIENNPEKYLEEYAELLQQLDQLKAKYKTLLLEHSGCYRKEWVDEQIRIKKIYEEDRQNYGQALQEIKEIAEDAKTKVFVDMEEFWEQILQKCEVLNEM